MTTARLKCRMKSEDEIRKELDDINKEFKVQFTLDPKVAEKGEFAVIKRLRPATPMPTIHEVDEPEEEQQVRMKR